MAPTLAKEFVNRKLQEYEEPVRKGKAKGETVGLSRRKFTAALIMAVYAVNTKEVEEVIGTRRGLISKWLTETKFRIQMEELRSEFVDTILQALTNGDPKSAFTDAQHYSADVKNMILGMGDAAAKKGDGEFLTKAWLLLRSALP
jgi:hypothetical protein